MWKKSIVKRKEIISIGDLGNDSNDSFCSFSCADSSGMTVFDLAELCLLKLQYYLQGITIE